MTKLRPVRAIEVLVVVGLMSGGGIAYAQRPKVCDILDSPQRQLLSGAGEMALMETCGQVPRAPAPSKQSSRESAKLLSTSPDDPGDGAVSASAVGSDVQVNAIPDAAPNTTQSEVTLAETGGILVAGWNDSSHIPTYNANNGFAVSLDGGTTWSDYGPLRTLPGLTSKNYGDPWIRAHHATGNFYYLSVAKDDEVPAQFMLPVYTDSTPWPGGHSPPWRVATNVTPGEDAGSLQDKPAMDVDNSGGAFDGRVYVCFRQFGGDHNIKLSTNDTTGVDAALAHVGVRNITATPDPLPPPGTPTTQGCFVDVDQSNGDVYVAWEDFIDAPRTIRARRSPAGGTAFGPEFTLVALAKIGHTNPDCCGNRQLMNGNIRVSEFISSMAVSPTTGNLHVVYASDGDGAGPDEADVFHIRCPPTGSDGIGACTTTPFKLNSDVTTNDQWHPYIDADPQSGTLAVFWYDRRNDPANMEIDVYKRFSFDDGASWTPDEKVTDVSFGVPPLCPNFDDMIVPCFMGEYNHITSDGSGWFYFAWGDNRNIVVNEAFPNGRPDPDVFFEKECVGVCCLPPFGQCTETSDVACAQAGGAFFCGESCTQFFPCPGTQGPIPGGG